jgi:hypothetical protein
MTVAMPSAIISTVRPATGASMRTGPRSWPCIMSSRASSGSRPARQRLHGYEWLAERDMALLLYSRIEFQKKGHNPGIC